MTKKRIYVDQLAGDKTMFRLNQAIQLYLKGEAELVFYTMEFSGEDIMNRMRASCAAGSGTHFAAHRLKEKEKKS